MPSMNRQPPSCQVEQSYWPWSLPETACSVMQATSMPALRRPASALCGSPSASPEMKLWLCRSVCTSSSDPERSSRDRRDAPVVPPRPPSVEASARGMAAAPEATASPFRKVRRCSGLMPGLSTGSRARVRRGRPVPCSARPHPGLRATICPMNEKVAILGAGKMGEALMSGLLRAGRQPGDLLFTERHDERTRLLEERYGVTGVTTVKAVEQADTLLVA